MIDALDDREYEALGCVVSQLGGASETFLNPGRNDAGIDFFARIPSPSHCHLFGGGIHPLRIVAQCKKYKTAVQGDKVDAFITTIQKVKHRGETKIEARIPIWFHEARGPIVGLIISHMGFQSGARDTAKNHGIITADSMDLAEIAATSKNLAENLGADKRAEECRKRTLELLK
jgi:predicted helicase